MRKSTSEHVASTSKKSDNEPDYAPIGVDNDQFETSNANDHINRQPASTLRAGYRDPQIFIGQVFGSRFALDPLARLQPYDWICANIPSHCTGTTIPRAFSARRFATAPLCSLCDGPHLSNSCNTLFPSGWPTAFSTKECTNNTANATERCNICDSTLHQALDCPLWHADLLLYGELRQFLTNEADDTIFGHNEIQARDVSNTSRYIPIRDELHNEIHGSSPIIPTSLVNADIPFEFHNYFEYYGATLDKHTRPNAYSNLVRTYELLLEWMNRQLQRASTLLPPNSHAIRQIQTDYSTIIMLWAMLTGGCLVRICDLPERITTNLATLITPDLDKTAYLFMWLKPDRQSVSWIIINQPDQNSVVFDARNNRFVLVRHLEDRYLPTTYASQQPIQQPTYMREITDNRDEFVQYFSTATPSLLIRQLSLLHYYEREQLLYPNVSLHPIHVRKLLNDYDELYKSSYTTSIISHLAAWLVLPAKQNSVANVIYPKSIAALNTPSESAAIDKRRIDLIAQLQNLHEPPYYIKIEYETIGVARLTLVGHIVDFPTSIKIVDPYGKLHEADQAKKRKLMSPTKIDEANKWIEKQTSQIWSLTNSLLKGDTTVFNAYISKYNDTISREADRKVPRWQPVQEAATKN